MKVNSTLQLKELIPELGRRDKFSKAIDAVLSSIEHPVTVQIADKFKCFTSKAGKQYKIVVTHDDHKYFLMPTKIKRYGVPKVSTEKNPESYRNIELSESYSIMNGVRHDYVNADVEENGRVNWADFANAIGKLVKDNPVFTCTCTKCNGTGFLPQFAWYAEGVCFECMGIGKWFELKHKNLQPCS